MKIKILVDSNEFFEYLKKDIQTAQKNIYVQAMTFEADNTGKELCELLKNCPAKDIRILIDSYIKVLISDLFLYSPRNIFNHSLRNEYSETMKLIRHLNNSGIQAKLTNPLGPLFIRYPGRNHKKLITIDNKIAYLGGINFSDHNFSWHDMMLRIEQQNIADFLEKDFLITWTGKNQCCKQTFNLLEFYILDGKSNENSFESIFKMIDEAKQTIFIESAYLTFPFYEKLRRAGERGVKITLLSPEKNNISILQKYTYWEARRSGINLQLFKNSMTHLKAMLIDDKILIVGSSNFDYLSYTSYQELILAIYDPDIITKFKNQVMQKDLNHSTSRAGKTPVTTGFIQYLILRAIGLSLVRLSRIFSK